MDLHRQAVEDFILPFTQDQNVVGIILTGSYFHSTPDKHSDIDIYIIEKDNSTRERGNTWVNDFEIEYFINPIKQIQRYFKDEDGKSPHTAHMFVNCEVLYQKGEYLEQLQEEAKEYLTKVRPKLTNTEIELLKYGMDDLWKDIQDSLEKEDCMACHLLSAELVNLCIKAFSRLHQFYPDKAKRLELQLKGFDVEFVQYLKLHLNSDSKKSKLSTLRNLKQYTEQLLGGARTKEWFLNSKCTVYSEG